MVTPARLRALISSFNPHVNRIEADHRFVDDDDFGVVEQCGGNRETLAGAMAEVLDLLCGIGTKGKLLKEFTGQPAGAGGLLQRGRR